ncbi:hypothetical protein CEXT_430311, partial [Caerostris extrusa]
YNTTVNNAITVSASLCHATAVSPTGRRSGKMSPDSREWTTRGPSLFLIREDPRPLIREEGNAEMRVLSDSAFCPEC